MKLHANAPLGPKGREVMVLLEVGCALSRRGADGIVESIVGAKRVVANRTSEQTIQVIAALRRVRATGPQIAEVLDRPLSTVRGSSPGSGWASSAGSGWSPPSATSASGPAS
jgi:hypothetical protein